MKRKLISPSLRLLEKAFSLDDLDEMYTRIRQNNGNGHFLSRFLDEMNVSYEISDTDRDLIPREGPVLVVANHPYGGIESAVMCVLLRSVRPDSKALSNSLLQRIPEVHDYSIFVDPFGGKTSRRANLAPLRETVAWLRAGKMLMVFPAGEVSHISWRHQGVVDPKWDPSIARIVRMTKCPVLPIFIEGHNSPLFQVAGLIHPRLRTAMLPHEMLAMRNARIRLAVGSLIPFEKMQACSTDTDLMDYLRFRTYLLEHRKKPAAPAQKHIFRPKDGQALSPIAPPSDPGLMASEAAHLPENQKLIENNNVAVYYAHATQIRNILFEIGRLRETAFRQEHEGTGKSFDLDRFDEHYLHLFVWEKTKKQVVGAYRIARTDRIMALHGKRGLYTSTLFKYKKKLLDQISPALELGRSFVHPEHQRNYSALHMLWRGIGIFIVRHPKYKTLFGPVSISNEYRSVSRWLLTEYLKHASFEHDLARLIRPRCKPRSKPARGCVSNVFDAAVKDYETIEGAISDVEGHEKGVPILLKQYLRLGGKLLGFNRDPHFGDVLDGLILVDLRHTDRKHLLHFMGKEGLESFLAYHAEAGLKGIKGDTPRGSGKRKGPGPMLRRFVSRRRSSARAKLRATQSPW
ncbi:MAG: GNAT family N-acyltransferase [bacterium]